MKCKAFLENKEVWTQISTMAHISTALLALEILSCFTLAEDLIHCM